MKGDAKVFNIFFEVTFPSVLMWKNLWLCGEYEIREWLRERSHKKEMNNNYIFPVIYGGGFEGKIWTEDL